MNIATIRLHFLTLFLSGKSPIAPGTVGSLVALILGVILLEYIPKESFLLLTILIAILAIKHIGSYEKETSTHDDKSIVIDELIGMWLALIICNDNYVFAFISFLTFRYFDVIKPSIIGTIDKKMSGGLGVVLDDVVAGIFGGILSKLIYHLYILTLPTL